MLRQEVRRLSAGSIRAQTLLERIRAEHDQVNQLTNELGRLKTQLPTLRMRRVELSAKIPNMQQRFDAGVIQATELEAAKALLIELTGRETESTLRESQLTGELNHSKRMLDELNKKLDEVERELLSPRP